MAIALVFSVVTPARAEGAVTIAELQSLVVKLSAQLVSLQTQLNQLQGGTTFNTDLTIGSRGQDVVRLQNFLIAKGFLSIEAGPVKDYYGAPLKSAVMKYQVSAGMPATGYFGPQTRAKINVELNETGNLVITNVAGMAAGNFEIDMNSKAYVSVNGVGTDPGAIKVYVGGIESKVTQASGNYIYFSTPTDGLVVGSSYDLYLKKGNQQSNTVKVKVLSKVTVSVDTTSTTPVLHIETDRKVYNSNVVMLPSKEETLFAIGYDLVGSAYANTLEVRFERTEGSGNFMDYAESVRLVDRFNRPLSFEGGPVYDGNTTIYKFTKLAHKITNREDFYVKIKAKKDLDKSAKFSMKVPKDGLRVGDYSYASGVITNTITFDPAYSLEKAPTTAVQSYVKVLSPNNGGTFNNNETIEIKYETNLDNTNSEGITLQLYKTTKVAGGAWEPTLTIATKLKNGKYLWQIPKDLAAGEYLIYAVGQGVWAQGASIGDYSDKAITIKPATGMGI